MKPDWGQECNRDGVAGVDPGIALSWENEEDRTQLRCDGEDIDQTG
jgi:hypothetical protein